MTGARQILLLCLIWLAPALATAKAQSSRRPIGSIPEFGPAILACGKPPAGSEGLEITLRFGVTSRGELRGPPMVTYSKLLGPVRLREDFARSAFKAVADCTPLTVTKQFGAIVAQRVIAVRFIQRRTPQLGI